MRLNNTSFMLLSLCLTVATLARADEPAPALPTPPQQSEPWTPPETRLPRFMTTAARTLFEQGLADPRGCEYRSIRIRLDDGRGGLRDVPTNGWVLPEPNGGKPRFAVAWSGLVHPLLDAGEPADLDLDVDGVRFADENRIARGRMPGGNMGWQDPAKVQEIAVVNLGVFNPIQTCLLLRLGRADLAETLWTRAGNPLAPKPKGAGPDLDLRSYDYSYMSMSVDFAWFRYTRAIQEHLAGEAARALAEFRALESLGKAIDAKAAELGFLPEQRNIMFARPQREHLFRYIDFLDQVPALLADQERRANERANPPPPPAEGDKAAALIRDLDQITSTHMGMFVNGVPMGPGGDSPTVKALIELGDDAVEPLIEVARSDDRLTRSINYQGDGFRHRSITRVDETAEQALLKILKAPSLVSAATKRNNGQPLDREARADLIQEYWDKNKDVPLVERWYRTLADDQAGAMAWLDAAVSITQPKLPPGQLAGAVFVQGPQPPNRPFQGEPLREGHAPSVSELMARRIQSLLSESGNQVQGPNQAMQMAGQLVAWDPNAAAPALRELSQEFRDRYDQARTESNTMNRQSLGAWIARLANLRAQVGDPSAFDDYIEWLKTITLAPNDPFGPGLLEPFQKHPQNPKLADAADWFFNDPESPWAVIIRQKDGRTIMRVAGMITSPTMELPAFTKMVREIALADRAVVGEAEVLPNGQIQVRFQALGSMSGITPRDQNNPDAAPIGAKTEVRARDVYAWRLSSRGDAPYFNPCWPEAQRDAAIEKIVEFLKR